jgi:hypothetical protein
MTFWMNSKPSRVASPRAISAFLVKVTLTALRSFLSLVLLTRPTLTMRSINILMLFGACPTHRAISTGLPEPRIYFKVTRTPYCSEVIPYGPNLSYSHLRSTSRTRCSRDHGLKTRLPGSRFVTICSSSSLLCLVPALIFCSSRIMQQHATMPLT